MGSRYAKKTQVPVGAGAQAAARGEPELETVPCKLCGRPIVWAVNPINGKRIPLDPRPVVYDVIARQVLGRDFVDLEAVRRHGCYVSHFATCPNVGDLKRTRNTNPAAGG